MDQQENISYLINIVNQIHKTTISLSQNQIQQFDILNKKYDSLNKKYDNLIGKYDSLEEKYDTLIGKYDNLDKKYDNLDKKYDNLDKKYDNLDKKIDRYYEENCKEHFEMRNLLAHIQNDIKDLRTDIDIVYELEIDTRKKIGL